MTERSPPLRTFGRVKGRPLKPRQAALVDGLLPHLSVDVEDAIDLDVLFAPQMEDETLRPPATPPAERKSAYVLEIGFGGGEHLVAQAGAHPDWGFIGAEPFVNGVGVCLRHIEESGVQNVRLHHGDARDVLDKLPDASLHRIYILFPDPWPKARHHKRRLIQPDFIESLARVLQPGGEVRFATDWRDYAVQTLATFLQSSRFTWDAERADDWRKPWSDHVSTRYEAKQLGDTTPFFLGMRRR